MALPASRIGDAGSGICSHSDHDPPISVTGVLIEGAPTVFINGRNASRVGHTVLASCGHTGIMINGSPSVIGTAPLVRVSDPFSGDFNGVLIEGSSTVFIG